ncbi:2-octaprenyl-6-methoxyphenyl hydroxylase [Rheinheimera riviphila]|uniref:2-octaprenyl-6-methoxyphenyl hydroxylase n=2 Tax=Rheinheimera riviphila TaxID=1834037 RepID=A0A437QMC4_9GAMM|nr:2-octaprenyl-6-methoxyphenyl hydroxylase [Rheinheimera riviphila]
MTGAMLAQVLLSQHPSLRLAIVEQVAEPGTDQSTKAPANSFDSRSIALAAGSVELLQQWGLWSEIAANACAIQQIQVSDRGHFGKTYLNAAEFNRQSLGQVLEIEWLGALLYPKLEKFSAQGRLHWFRPDRIHNLQTSPEQQILQLQSGVEITAKLLIICEGGDSPTRQLAGMELTQQPYSQAALISNVGLAETHQHIAFERFTADGPIALLPLTKQRYSLVWTLPPQQAQQILQLPDEQFLQQLQQAFGYRAGVFQKVGQRQLYPLTLKYSAEPSRHRVLLCGNSLHNLHPIAGQGFNLALRDIAAITGLIATQLTSDKPADVGCYAVTRAYQQLRQPDISQVIQFTDTLVRLFSNNSRLIALGRSLGLTALMNCPELKTKFAKQSMGLSPILRQQQQLESLLLSGNPAASKSVTTNPITTNLSAKQKAAP